MTAHPHAFSVLHQPSDLARIITDSAADSIFLMNAAGQITFVNPAAEAVFGWTQEELLGRGLHDVIHHHHSDGRDYPRSECPLVDVLSSGQALKGHEDVFFRKDGSSLDVSCSNAPIVLGGEVIGSVLIVYDITEQKRNEAALRDSEAFSRSILDNSPDCIKVVDLDGRLLYMNGPGLCIMEIDDFSSLQGQEWAGLWPEESRKQITQSIAEAKAGRKSAFSAFCPTAKGTPRWWDVIVSPITDENGRPTRLLSVSRDVTERKDAEERRALLMREMHHRVKNTLATVQAVINSTARTAETMTEFRQAVTDRIISLSKTHTLLLDDQRGGASLGDLFRNELAAYDDGSGHRVKIDGAPVHLPYELALTMGMAVHELTTNAAKYGALSVPTGSVEVNWAVRDVEDERLLRVEWTERDGPAVQPPSRQGFGSVLLERVLGRQLQGKVNMDYARDGVRATVEAPLRPEA